MKKITINLYSFDELSEEAKQKVLNDLASINVDYEWWDYDFEDAKNSGLKITSFNINDNTHGKGEFTRDAVYCADKIIETHDESCETYKTAETFLKERDEITNTATKDENGDFEDLNELYKKLDERETVFLTSILIDYSTILQKEYDYRTSNKSIIETIKTEKFTFEPDGTLRIK